MIELEHFKTNLIELEHLVELEHFKIHLIELEHFKKHLIELEHLIEVEHFKTHLIELEHFKKHFIELEHSPDQLIGELIELEHFKKTFDRARTFTRIFDCGVVRRRNNDLKSCRRFFYAAGRKGRCSNFLLVEWKNDDELFISGEEKLNEFFMLSFL